MMRTCGYILFVGITLNNADDGFAVSRSLRDQK